MHRPRGKARDPSAALFASASAGRRARAVAAQAAAIAGGVALAVLLLGRSGAPIAAAFAAFWWLAVVIVVRSDLERFIIPDEASLVIAALGLGYAGVSALADPGPSPMDVLRAVSAAGLNGALAFGLFWLIGRIYRARSGRTGLGFGDVKLAGASALWLAPSDGAAALEIAALAGLALVLVGRRGANLRDVAIPFGAVLAPAAWLVFVAGPSVRAALDPFS